MKDEVKGGKGRSFPVDPNLPRWVCQNCRHALCVVGVESYSDKFFNDPSRSGLGIVMQASSVQGSMLGSTRMDHSFVILSKQKAQGHGIPPRPKSGLSQSEGNPSAKGMEESFVVLPPAAASMYKSSSTSEGSGDHLPTPSVCSSTPLQTNNSGFHSSITVLKRAFDIATSQTQIEAEERRLQGAIEDTERQFAEVKAQKKELESKSKCFRELEERYWHEYNDFQFQLASHQEDRDAILAKIEVFQAHLELLKRTNVLTDAFPICHDGEFGTINNFRLGRLPKTPVEWDEINAAWGQACLLLHTMAQYFRPKFPYGIKIIPMGSYPRMVDNNNNTYELFGPVNLFWSTRYDKAMTLFLACLKEFADFANTMDQENHIPPEKCFRLPYKIENDKVGTYTITQSFNKQENWTKALKYMLCNLKWVLYWFVRSTNFQPMSGSSHHSEAPNNRIPP